MSINKVGIMIDDPTAILNIKTSEIWGEHRRFTLQPRDSTWCVNQTWIKVSHEIHTLDWACSWWSFRFASADLSSRNSVSLSSTCQKKNYKQFWCANHGIKNKKDNWSFTILPRWSDFSKLLSWFLSKRPSKSESYKKKNCEWRH